MNFEALILAAGYGTRLGELTKDTPKPLVNLFGKPLIYFVIERLKRFGVTKIYVNTHYLADKMDRYFKENNLDVEIETVYEEEILNTGVFYSQYSG